MKRKMIAALAFTMMLCGCGKAENEQKSDTSSANTTTAATTSAESTTTEAASAETTSTDAKSESEKASDTTTTAAASEDTTAEAAENGTDAVYKDLFAGYYLDENSNASMSIDCVNDVLYKVSISHKTSDTETAEWYFTGEFNGRQVLNYDSCVKSIMSVAEDSSVSSEKVYTDGTGYLQISEEGTKTGIVWVDDKENAGAGYFFIKQ